MLKTCKILFFSIARSACCYFRKRIKHAVLQKNNKNSILASNASINNCELSNYVVVFNNVILENTKIGEHSYIQRDSKIFNSVIGKFCSIASNVTIAPGIHPTNQVSTHPAFFLQNTPLAITFADRDYFAFSKKVEIGNDVWIGERAIILDGITIGSGAIIAAGSVVTKNVQPYAVVGGVPAKFIRYRFSEAQIEFLLKFNWWDRDQQWISDNWKKWHRIDEFIYENEHNDEMLKGDCL